MFENLEEQLEVVKLSVRCLLTVRTSKLPILHAKCMQLLLIVCHWDGIVGMVGESGVFLGCPLLLLEFNTLGREL